MEPVETYTTIAGGYSQSIMTPPPVIASEKSADFEAIGSLYVQNEQLKKRIAELEAEISKGGIYKQRYYTKCEECDDLKKENKLLKEENKLLKQQQETGVILSEFRYSYDVTAFKNEMESTDIERLMDILLELAEMPQPQGYLIEASMDIVPVYILLAERGTFRVRGESDNRNWGLTAFCDCWNNNVVCRIADITRKDGLTCDSVKIKNELSREPWRNSASCSWSNLYDGIAHRNGQNSRKKTKLGRAVNVKKRMEKFLEQIPSLKSKKY